MRTRSFLLVLLLLVFSISQAAGGGRASGSTTGPSIPTWDGLARHTIELGPLQVDNNTTAPPPSFADLVPAIIFILAGVGIAIVIVAAGLWIAGRRRRERGGEGGNPGGVEEGKEGEDEEWGAKW